MKILLAASEIYPFAKTGGLADVIYSLTNELFGLGHDVKLILPGYPQLYEVFRPSSNKSSSFKIADFADYEIEHGHLDKIRADVFLIKSKRIFEDTRKLYQGRKFKEFLRYLTLSDAAAKVAMGDNPLEWRTEILHAHDWHAGMAFNCLDSDCGDIARVFSIHNIAFAGKFPKSFWDLASEPGGAPLGLKFAKSQEISFLEEALLGADKINTVSKSYAEEIKHERFGFGFEDILLKRERDLFGILNGVDYNIWHPEQDPHLPMSDSAFSDREKRYFKSHIQQKYNLNQDSDALLCSFTNRLTHQKMIDIVIDAVKRMDSSGIQFVFHADGHPEIENALRRLQQEKPGQVAFVERFQEKTEHLLLGGSDLCLSPSRFEPCGLNALYAMRYGALPLVRPVGGFKDTVVDAFSEPEHGNGFYMTAESVSSFIYAMKRIRSLFKDKDRWADLVENAKRQNFSWRHSATEYVKLYRLAIRRRYMMEEIQFDSRQSETPDKVQLAG